MNGNESTGPSRIDPRRGLPSVSALMADPALRPLQEAHSRALVLEAVQEALALYRSELAPGLPEPPTAEVIERVRACLLREEHERIRPVVNATGILLHTGLGRALLPARAAAALGRLDRCCNLQIDLETGLRGKRNFVTERLLCRITGAEAATICNHNAAATLLLLAATCAGKEVVVSRGQLIEIGGAFRLPDCIHHSGARLVEVGTTNRTHLRDYQAALGPETAAVLRCNPSNYRVIGFHKEVPVAELAELKAGRPDLLVIDDLGCGNLVDLTAFGLPPEPTVQESLQAGADLVCFSGDKLISGPQAGIIVGRRELIQKIKKHPLSRMLRVCKLTDTALEQTLRLFLEPERLPETNPTLRLLTLPLEELERRGRSLLGRLQGGCPRLEARLARGESATGGGSLPGVGIPSWIVSLRLPGTSADRLSLLLRRHEPPIVARIEADEVHLDMRTLLPGDEDAIVAALARLVPSARKEAP